MNASLSWWVAQRLKEARQKNDKMCCSNYAWWFWSTPTHWRFVFTTIGYKNFRNHKSTKASYFLYQLLQITICRNKQNTISERNSLFQNASHRKVSTQHNHPNDPEQMTFFEMTISGIAQIPSDFQMYKTLSHLNLDNLNDFFCGIIIVIGNGNYECKKLNILIENIWAHHFDVVPWNTGLNPIAKVEYQKLMKNYACWKTSIFLWIIFHNCPAYCTHNTKVPILPI